MERPGMFFSRWMLIAGGLASQLVGLPIPYDSFTRDGHRVMPDGHFLCFGAVVKPPNDGLAIRGSTKRAYDRKHFEGHAVVQYVDQGVQGSFCTPSDDLHMRGFGCFYRRLGIWAPDTYDIFLPSRRIQC
jgi:hypothetical protein